MKKIQLAITDPEYKKWIDDIEQRFRRQQIKAAVQVNSSKIEFYWSLGRDICEMQVEKRYGEGVIKSLSRDLREVLPDAKGFASGTLYYCKRFYLLYNQLFEKFPQLGDKSSLTLSYTTDMESLGKVPQLGEIFKPQHSVIEESVMPLNIFAIPWGHHKVLIDRFESEPIKALFYAVKTLEQSWSRAVLENMIGEKGQNNRLYEHQGKAVNNFPKTLPYPTGDLARELIDDPLNLSFVKLKKKYDETTLKQALVRHVSDLLMKLGSGFAYMGKEYSCQWQARSSSPTFCFTTPVCTHTLSWRSYVVHNIRVHMLRSYLCWHASP